MGTELRRRRDHRHGRSILARSLSGKVRESSYGDRLRGHKSVADSCSATRVAGQDGMSEYCFSWHYNHRGEGDGSAYL